MSDEKQRWFSVDLSTQEVKFVGWFDAWGNLYESLRGPMNQRKLLFSESELRRLVRAATVAMNTNQSREA